MIDERALLVALGQAGPEECREAAALFSVMAKAGADFHVRAEIRRELEALPPPPHADTLENFMAHYVAFTEATKAGASSAEAWASIDRGNNDPAVEWRRTILTALAGAKPDECKVAAELFANMAAAPRDDAFRAEIDRRLAALPEPVVEEGYCASLWRQIQEGQARRDALANQEQQHG